LREIFSFYECIKIENSGAAILIMNWFLPQNAVQVAYCHDFSRLESRSHKVILPK